VIDWAAHRIRKPVFSFTDMAAKEFMGWILVAHKSVTFHLLGMV
jgi:hypothetical protein